MVLEVGVCHEKVRDSNMQEFTLARQCHLFQNICNKVHNTTLCAQKAKSEVWLNGAHSQLLKPTIYLLLAIIMCKEEISRQYTHTQSS